MELPGLRGGAHHPKPVVLHEQVAPAGRHGDRAGRQPPAARPDDDRHRHEPVEPGGQTRDEALGHVLHDEHGLLQVDGQRAEQRQQRLRATGGRTDGDQPDVAAPPVRPERQSERPASGGRTEGGRVAGQPLRAQSPARMGDHPHPRGDAELAPQHGGVLLQGAGVLRAGFGQHVDRTRGEGLQRVLAVRPGHESAVDQDRCGA